MLVRSALLAILSVLPALVIGKQIPTIDGVIAGGPIGKELNNINLLKVPISNTASSPTPGKLRVVENSGLCETTPNVYQASGYVDFAANKSMWFWFFAARNNPDTAPLIVWLNGGPGASSMVGLFQELGPCRINNGSTGVDLNPMSWNNNANVLFIDQPVGAGFSYGSLNVGTSREAAVDVWEFLQIWFSDRRFSKYASRDFAIWTESYGGHYGPVFSAYFLDQNDAILNGTIRGVCINLKVLGIGDGLTDPLAQYPGYIEYAKSNRYHPLVNDTVISSANTSWEQPGGCKDQITACNNGGSNTVCSDAQKFCNANILEPLSGEWDVYYVLTPYPDPYPPPLDSYLNKSEVMSKIGANSNWSDVNIAVYLNFLATGDWMRTSLPELERVINAGVRTIIYDGDADYILNFMGVEAMVASLKTKFSSLYASQNFSAFTVNGTSAGLFKNAGNFSYLRFAGAGHEVPTYQWGNVTRGAAALQMFTQFMSGKQLHGT